MATQYNRTLKIRRKSAAAAITPAEVTRRINETLGGLVKPCNGLCEPGDTVNTLRNAHQVLDLLETCELEIVLKKLNDENKYAISLIRRMAQDAVGYAVELVEGSNNLRGAFDGGGLESVTAIEAHAS